MWCASVSSWFRSVFISDPPCRGVQGGPDPPGSEIQISDPPGRTPLDPEGESSKSWIFVQICSKNNTNFDCRSTKYKIFRLRRADSDFSILNLSKSLIFKNQGGLGPPWIWDWNLGPPWPDPPGFEASRNTGDWVLFGDFRYEFFAAPHKIMCVLFTQCHQ